jgi:hypothetical protein
VVEGVASQDSTRKLNKLRPLKKFNKPKKTILKT